MSGLVQTHEESVDKNKCTYTKSQHCHTETHKVLALILRISNTPPWVMSITSQTLLWIHPSLAPLLETFGNFTTDLPLRMQPWATSRIPTSDASKHQKSPLLQYKFVSLDNKFNGAWMCGDTDILQMWRHSQHRSHRTTWMMWMVHIVQIHRYFPHQKLKWVQIFPYQNPR